MWEIRVEIQDQIRFTLFKHYKIRTAGKASCGHLSVHPSVSRECCFRCRDMGLRSKFLPMWAFTGFLWPLGTCLAVPNHPEHLKLEDKEEREAESLGEGGVESDMGSI